MVENSQDRYFQPHHRFEAFVEMITTIKIMSMITIKMIMMKIKMVMMVMVMKKKKKKTSFSRYFQKVCRLHLCPENSPGASLCSKSSLYLFTLISDHDHGVND